MTRWPYRVVRVAAGSYALGPDDPPPGPPTYRPAPKLQEDGSAVLYAVLPVDDRRELRRTIRLLATDEDFTAPRGTVAHRRAREAPVLGRVRYAGRPRGPGVVRVRIVVDHPDYIAPVLAGEIDLFVVVGGP